LAALDQARQSEERSGGRNPKSLPCAGDELFRIRRQAQSQTLKNSDVSPHPMAGKKDVVWFALDKSRPLFSFAGIWTAWEGARGTKSKPIEGKHQIYAFLTCPSNGVVAPVTRYLLVEPLLQGAFLSGSWQLLVNHNGLFWASWGPNLTIPKKQRCERFEGATLFLTRASTS
jgi:hypothetical protein